MSNHQVVPSDRPFKFSRLDLQIYIQHSQSTKVAQILPDIRFTRRHLERKLLYKTLHIRLEASWLLISTATLFMTFIRTR